jgi:L-iditol 2-dehydrogenase
VDLTKAAVYDRDGNIEIKDVALPPVGAGDLLVKMTACGICPGEVLGWYVARKAPFVLGHEQVGVIEECGADAGPFGPGERVFVHHHAPCMRCRRCERGDYVQCDTWRSTKLIPGGMAAHAVVTAPIVAADVLPLPDGIDDDTGTFIEPLATVVKSVRRAGIERGDRVLVIGLGVMGLLHVMLARLRGAETIIGADGIAPRRAKVLEMGADHAFEPEGLAQNVRSATGGEGADVVIVGPGSIAAMDAAVTCVARGGTIVLFTPLPQDARWPLPVHDLYFNDISVIASYSAGPDDTREALHILEGGMPVKRLITHRLPLRDARKAYKLVADAGETLKVIVYPNRS